MDTSRSCMDEAGELVKNHNVYDKSNELRTMTEPELEEDRELAKELGTETSAKMEECLQVVNSIGYGPKQIGEMNQRLGAIRESDETMAGSYDYSEIDDKLLRLAFSTKKWVSSKKPKMSESEMYPEIRAFVMFAVEMAYHRFATHKNKHRYCAILAVETSDHEPADSDDKQRIDLGFPI